MTAAAEKLGLHFGLSSFVIGVFIVASVLFYPLTQDKKISRSEGLLFFVFYAFFISKAVAAFI